MHVDTATVAFGHLFLITDIPLSSKADSIFMTMSYYKSGLPELFWINLVRQSSDEEVGAVGWHEDIED